MTQQIEFTPRPLMGSPLEVLEHLYYYTHQYGLSVSQFTGKHWKYWKGLPERLRIVQDSPHELESIIQELESLAEGSAKRLKKRQDQIKKERWAEKEVILNAQLLTVLAALPHEMLATGFKKVTRGVGMPPNLEIVDLDIREDFLEPDLLLLGEGYLLMVEIKTRGNSSSVRKYPPNQLLNYLQLVVKCLDSEDTSLPQQFAHLIIVPSDNPKWLEQSKEWIIDTCDKNGRMQIDSSACIKLSKKKKYYDYDVLNTLANKIPVYYRSWQQLAEGFEQTLKEFEDEMNRQHWSRIVKEIRKISNTAGKYS
ncbi:hypothetical protein ACFL6E_05110 [Candidatus Neomarinimicrobiota bacterium]